MNFDNCKTWGDVARILAATPELDTIPVESMPLGFLKNYLEGKIKPASRSNTFTLKLRK